MRRDTTDEGQPTVVRHRVCGAEWPRHAHVTEAVCNGDPGVFPHSSDAAVEQTAGFLVRAEDGLTKEGPREACKHIGSCNLVGRIVVAIGGLCGRPSSQVINCNFAR